MALLFIFFSDPCIYISISEPVKGSSISHHFSSTCSLLFLQTRLFSLLYSNYPTLLHLYIQKLYMTDKSHVNFHNDIVEQNLLDTHSLYTATGSTWHRKDYLGSSHVISLVAYIAEHPPCHDKLSISRSCLLLTSQTSISNNPTPNAPKR